MKNKIVRLTLLVIAGILAFEFGAALRALSGKGPEGENSMLPEYSMGIPTFAEDEVVVPPAKKLQIGTAPTVAQSVQIAMLPVKKDYKGVSFSQRAEVFPKNEQLFHSPHNHTAAVEPSGEAQEPYRFTGSGTPAFSPGGIAPRSQGGGGSAFNGHGQPGNDQPQNDQPKDDEQKQVFPPETTLALTDPQDSLPSTLVLPDQTLPENISDLPGVPDDTSKPSGQNPRERIADATPQAVPEGGVTALLLGMGLSSLVWIKERNKRFN